MESTKQPVLAGGLLSKLGELFFKGMGNILDAAAEYEEEFGVLKQKTVLNLKDEKTGKDYTLTIKLSPVKDKEGKFWVEAETTAPDLDLSSINKKVFDLNKSKKDDFNNMVNKLLEEHNLKTQNNSSTESSQDIDSIIAQINEDFKDMVIESEDGSEVDLKVNGKVTKNNNKLLLEVSLSDGEEETDKETADIDFLSEDDGSILPIETIEDKIVDAINNLFQEEIEQQDSDEEDSDEVNSSTVIKSGTSIRFPTVVEATFIKSSKTGKVKLTSITASRNIDIEDALDIAYDVAEDTDFVDSLNDRPESYEIIETSRGYNVNKI